VSYLFKHVLNNYPLFVQENYTINYGLLILRDDHTSSPGSWSDWREASIKNFCRNCLI